MNRAGGVTSVVYNERWIVERTRTSKEREGSKERRSLLLTMVVQSPRCSPSSGLKR